MIETLPTGTRSGAGSGFFLVLLFVAGIGISLSMSFPILAASDWDPTIFIKFPEGIPELLEYGEDRLGEVSVAPRGGHDGKFYFVQAMDPFYLHPEANAYLLDRPTYRAQRMLYPTVVSVAGLGGPWAVVWAMYIANAIGIGLGCVVTALVARELGLSKYFGLAFAANLGMLSAGIFDTAEVFGFGLLMLGLYFCLRKSWGWMAFALTLAGLARESMLAGVFGVAVYLVLAKVRLPRSLIYPLIVPAAWFAYLQLRIGYLPGYEDHAPVIAAPFTGFLKALVYWNSEPGQAANMAVGILLMAISVVFLVRVVRSRDPVVITGASFALIAVIMAEVVWYERYDSSRALAPLMTLFILSIPRGGRGRTESVASDPGSVREAV
jgi:hypothetical protein